MKESSSMEYQERIVGVSIRMGRRVEPMAYALAT